MVADPQPAEPDREVGRAAIEREWCRRRFSRFVRHWRFVNRESGQVLTLGDAMWPGQERLSGAMDDHSWLFALKAGKLGFTEMECAFDAWRALFAAAHARVHLFSKNGEAARELLQYVRFGLTDLPDFLRPEILADVAGGDTVRSLRLRPPAWAAEGEDDVRTIISYNTERHVGVDLSCQHSHIDELWAQPFPRETWSAVASTVAPDGTCHIITRGGGQGSFVTELWEQSKGRGAKLYQFFEPWTARSDRDRDWYDGQHAIYIEEQLSRFAPERAEDALYAADIQDFVPMALWDACKDSWNEETKTGVKPLIPGDKIPLVLGVDAGTKNDSFAIVAVSRNRQNIREVDVRGVREWRPPPGGAIDYSDAESFLRATCKGGCAMGHYQERPWKMDKEGAAAAGKPVCPACRDGMLIPAFNVRCITYDAHQLVSMMQSLVRDGVAWCLEFSQLGLRLQADRSLYLMVVRREIHHDGNEALRTHVQNAKAKLQKEEESTMRIVKKAENKHVDILVALSMATYQCRELLLE